MKIKPGFKKLKALALMLFLALALYACAPVSAMAVDLPDSVQISIDGLLIVGVALLIELAVARIPWLSFFRAYAQEWGLALSALLIGVLEGWLPGGVYESASILGVQFVIAVIAAWLAVRRFLIRRNVQGFTEG